MQISIIRDDNRYWFPKSLCITTITMRDSEEYCQQFVRSENRSEIAIFFW